MEVNNQNEIDLSEIYIIIKRHIVIILAIAFISAIAVFSFTKFFVAKQYVSSGTIIVNNRKDEASGNITNDEINSAKGLTSVYSIIIKSDPIMETVINNLSLEYSVSQLQSMISISSVNATQVMKVSVKANDPDIAALIVNEVLFVAPESIVDKVEAGSVKIISEAKTNPVPVAPNVNRNAILTFFIAALMSAGVFIMLELLDKTIKSEQDMEKHLGLPMLGIIPNVSSVKGPSK